MESFPISGVCYSTVGEEPPPHVFALTGLQSLPTRDWSLLAPTPSESVQDGHCPESDSESTQAHNCAYYHRKSGKQGSQISPQALCY